MRLGFFTDSYRPNVDGVVRSIEDFRGELERRGDEVFVFASGSRSDKRANRDDHVYYSTSVRLPPYPQYKVAVFPFVRAATRSRANGLELVHSHGQASMGVAAITTAKALRVPLVGTFHTLIPHGVKNYVAHPGLASSLERFSWRAIEYFYRPFDVVTAPSKFMARLLQEHGVEAVALPNGVNVRKFRPAASKAWLERKVGREGPFVLCLGRVSPEKNISLVIDAFRTVRRETGATLVVAGTGPQLAELKAGADDSVVFTGFVDDRDLSKYYSAADAFVTASTFETQGLTVLEAMACGTPVAAARSMALPEVVKDKRNGFLFAPGNVDSCARAVMRAMLSKRVLTDECRRTAQKYSVPRVTDELSAIYGALL